MPGVVAAAAALYAAYSYMHWFKGMATTAWSVWHTFRSERLEHSLRHFHHKAPTGDDHKMCVLEQNARLHQGIFE
jgi:transposase